MVIFIVSTAFILLHQKTNMNLLKTFADNKGVCNIVMFSDDTKISQYNQSQKCDKAAFIIYADLEYIIENIDGYKNNPQNSSTTKVTEHIPSGFSMSTISSFTRIFIT